MPIIYIFMSIIAALILDGATHPYFPVSKVAICEERLNSNVLI